MDKLVRAALTPRIAVIGAGISGLVAAHRLQQHGFDVTVFEKSRGPGGRTATRRVDSRLSFDHGAQYFTARDPDFVRQVEAWVEQGLVAEWTGRIVSIDGPRVQLKTDQPQRYVGVPGMTAIARRLAETSNVLLETRIVRLERVDGAWRATDNAEKSYGPFEHVIVSLPAPQSAELLADHRSAVTVRAIPMTPCWAVLAAFDRPVEAPWDGAFVQNSRLAWVARNSSKPGREGPYDCWVLHASSDWSAANLDLARETVATTLLGDFASLTGGPSPAAVHLDAHRWLYSATPMTVDRLVIDDGDTGLLVCGDWLAGGRVEGAFRSGVAAAECLTRWSRSSEQSVTQ